MMELTNTLIFFVGKCDLHFSNTIYQCIWSCSRFFLNLNDLVRLKDYRKVPKFWDAINLCCNPPKIQTETKPKGYFVKIVKME